MTDDSDNLPEKTIAVPVTVPKEVEEAARERLEKDTEQGRAPDFGDERDQLAAYLMDYLQPDPQYLTRDVVHEEYDEPLTHALYTCVTEDDYEAVVEAVGASEDVGSVQEYVREAVRNSLENGGL